MILRKSLASLAAATLVATPVAIQAAPRESTPVEGEQLKGSPWIPILLIFLVLSGILLLANGDKPRSP